MPNAWLRRCVLVAAMLLLLPAIGHAADLQQTKLPIGTPNTIVCVRIASINAFIKSVTEMATAIEENAGMMVGPSVQMMLQQIPGIDPDGPVAILFLDPNKYDQPAIGVVTLKDAKAFKEGVRMAPVRVVGPLGLISSAEGALAEAEKALRIARLKVVPTNDMTDLIVVTAHVGDLLKRCKKDIAGQLQLAKLKLGAMEPDADNTKKMAAKALNYAGKLITAMEDEVGLIEYGVKFDRKEIAARVAVDAAPGGLFDGFLRKNQAHVSRTLARYLPKEAVASAISQTDPASRAQLAVALVTILADITGMDQPETQSICRAVDGLSRNLTGLEAMAVLEVKGSAAGVELYGIKDPAAARAHTKAVLGLARGDSVGKLLRRLGVTVLLTEKHRVQAGIPVDKIDMTVDLDKLMAALPLPLEPDEKGKMLDAIKKMYGKQSTRTVETVYGARLMAVVDSSEGPELMNKQIELIRTDGRDGLASSAEYRAALVGHPEESCTLVHLSLFGYSDLMHKQTAKQMAKLPDAPQVEMYPTRAELPAAETFVGASIRIEGSRVTGRAVVPVRSIAALVKAAQKKQAEMRQKMMEQPVEPEMDAE